MNILDQWSTLNPIKKQEKHVIRNNSSAISYVNSRSFTNLWKVFGIRVSQFKKIYILSLFYGIQMLYVTFSLTAPIMERL